MKFFIGLLTFFNFSVCFARAIEINVRDYGWATSSQPVKDIIDFYLQGVENDLNNDQPIINPARFNYAAANSSVLASKGLGTDYVNEPKKYQIGLGLGVAWDDEKNKAIRDEISGAAAASSLTLGIPLNWGPGTKKFMGYINFGTISHSEIIPSSEVDIAGDIKATNFGLHLRYDLIDKTGSEWLGWGGLKLHLGYEYNKNTVNLTTQLDEPIEVDTGGAGILEGRLTGKPVYKVETQTHSIPFEVSSSVFFLKVLSLYGGMGADMNFGQSKGKGDINGDVSTLACTSGVCAGETVLPQLETQANYNAKSQVRNMTFRAFAGAQIDLPLRLHVFAQLEQMLGTKVTGASAGLKYSY